MNKKYIFILLLPLFTLKGMERSEQQPMVRFDQVEDLERKDPQLPNFQSFSGKIIVNNVLVMYCIFCADKHKSSNFPLEKLENTPSAAEHIINMHSPFKKKRCPLCTWKCTAENVNVLMQEHITEELMQLPIDKKCISANKKLQFAILENKIRKFENRKQYYPYKHIKVNSLEIYSIPRWTEQPTDNVDQNIVYDFENNNSISSNFQEAPSNFDPFSFLDLDHLNKNDLISFEIQQQ